MGSFLYASGSVISTTKWWEITIFVVICQADSIFFCVSGDYVGHIYKYNASKSQNPILLLTPMCQDTPCHISHFYVYFCNFSEFIFAFTQFRQNNMLKRGFRGMWDILTTFYHSSSFSAHFFH